MSAMMVPKGWEIKRLGELAKFKGGNGFSEDLQGQKTGDYLFLKVSDMSLQGNEKYINVANNYVDKELVKTERYTLFPPNTVIFAKVGAALLLNRRRILNKESALDNNMMGAVIKNDFPYMLLYHILTTIDFENYVQTGALPSINQETLTNIEILVPKLLSEQQKISTIISTLDRTIEATKKLIDKEKMVKKGLMADLLTHGIDEQGRIRSPQTHTYVDSPLGMIPEGWEVKPLSDFFKLKSGDTKPIDTSSQGLYGVYGGNGITGYSNDCNNDAITLVIGRVGEYCGCVYKVDKCWITDNALLIDKKILSFDTNYMFFLLTFLNLNQYKSETGQPLLNQTIIGKVTVPYVSKQEQQKIAIILSAQDRKIKTEETNLAKLQNLKKGLMGDLLSGKVRVK